MSELTARLVKLGRDLGLEGPELRAFGKERGTGKTGKERSTGKTGKERSTGKTGKERSTGKTGKERRVRGPADMIADQYIGQQNIVKEAAFVHEYAKNLQREITDSCKIAAETAKNQFHSYTEAKSDHRRYREFAKGDKVLILLPQDGNNLFMKYQGPYKIDGVAQNNNYIFTMRNGKRTYHANIWKKYEEREPSPPLQPVVENACTGFVRHEEYEEMGIIMLEPKRKEYSKDVTISENLTPQQNKEARDLLQTFAGTLSDISGKMETVEHKIRLTNETPFRMKQYPLPVHAMDEVDKEINFMLKSGIISKSTSPYASPITVVMKKDGAIRLCLDFRKLNKITIFDAEPIPTLDELLGKMKGAKFFTKCDLTKGYWQIPMHEDSKAYTAFYTTQGLMEFNYMPFGLSTTACTFQRAMLDTLRPPYTIKHV
ncbi:reverse transcriptase [Plakobranchus ocellatus]|uniref:Reverse transcriptase n=1 Tax=Plakobranchus ocellatus TaxID=259542 RepID=A0AAV4D6K3_9GAST|nr:reverse transcriptase [Plakobranchus ocellatus]